jgi:hypothetical protein
MTRLQHSGACARSVFRIYMGGNAIVTWFIAMTDPRSLMHSVASTGEGAALVWLLMLVGVAAVLDALINDLLPERFRWRVALRQRHFILAAMAFCYVAQLYVAFFNFRSTGLLLYYLWNASMIMLAAFLDAHQRSKDASCVIVCN